MELSLVGSRALWWCSMKVEHCRSAMTMSEVSDMGEGIGLQAFGPDRDGHRLLRAPEGAGSRPSPIGDSSSVGYLAAVSPGRHAVAQSEGHRRQGQRFDLAPPSRAVGADWPVGAGSRRLGWHVAGRSDPDPRYL